MVEVKYKSVFEKPFLLITIFSLLVFVVVPIWGMLKAFWDVFDVGMNDESIKLFVLCAIVLGITMKCSVKLFSKTLLDKVQCFRWEKIDELDFYPIDIFCFYNLENRSLHKVCLSSFNTNVKPALELAVTKIPYYKISDAARQKLRKKYGIIIKVD